MSTTAPSFVITTIVRGSARSQIWESGDPLALGHPFQWALERAGEGLRIRDLSAPLDRVENGRIHEIPSSSLERGPYEIELRGHRFRIQRARTIPSVSDSAATGREMRVHRCAGAWVLESHPLRKKYTARIQKTAIYELEEAGEAYRLTARVAGLKLSVSGGATRALNSGEKAELSRPELARALLSRLAPGSTEIQSWRFSLADAPAFVDEARETDPFVRLENEQFRKALRSALLGLCVLIGLSWVWPKPRDDSRDLIPPQFARIVMTQLPKSHEKASASSDAGAASSRLPSRVRNSAVVQAFRAKALNQAVSGLLKGGMSRLLAQSDFVAGAARSEEAQGLFNSRPEALRSSGLISGAGTLPGAVKVASLGGDGHGSGGLGVGYGKGRHAGVKGQGKGFVPFVAADADGSAVDEGLTRDEVGEVIHRHLSEVRYCYESAMIRTPDIEGKLMTAFTINGHGVVKSADVKSSTLPDPRLDDCIIRRLVTWQFPKPRGGVDVAVSYPFIFKTLGR